MKYKNTKEIKVSTSVIDQIIGQDEAVNVIKKAAKQKRHVLLIGDPGTGKSMLGQAMAELLPKEKLQDIVSIHNTSDENSPLIRTFPKGEAKSLIERARIQGAGTFRFQNIFFFALVALSLIAPWWIRKDYGDIMAAASLIGSMIFLGAFVLFMNVSRRMKTSSKIPKLIVDNSEKANAPFIDATGAHAGALLGDVLHDPFQSFFGDQQVYLPGVSNIEKNNLNKEIDFLLNYNGVIKNESKYEASFTSKNQHKILGATDNKTSTVESLSCNRYNYEGDLIKLKTGKNKELIITPEHKIAVLKNGKVEFLQAKDIKEGDEVAVFSEVILDEEDIINTYSEKQREQARLYKKYLKIKLQNPDWGYKRISKAMDQPIGKTRWWHAGKYTPKPIQTINFLKEKGLLPLRLDHPRLPLIAKVSGALLGDGGIFENLNGIFLSSSELDATREFGRDLAAIFGKEVYQNKRTIEGGIEGHSWCYQNTNRKMIRFFKALGVPIGNKTRKELYTPNWVCLTEELKNNFFGSLLGSELGVPKVHKNLNCLNTLDFGICGKKELDKNRIDFLNNLKEYLEEKGIETTSILRQKGKTDGKILYRLMISTKFDNVVRFIKNIKINYCEYKKDKLIHTINKFSKFKKQRYNQLIERGYGAEHAMKTLQLTPRSLYTILNGERMQWN